MVLAKKERTNRGEPSNNLPGTGNTKASLKQVKLPVQGPRKKALTEKDFLGEKKIKAEKIQVPENDLMTGKGCTADD